MTMSNSSAVPTSTPNHTCATAVPSKYSARHPSPFFRKHFIKPKLTLGNVVIFPTVHDRRLGYLNSSTLCRGCTLYHTIRILIVWASSPHSILCHDKHPIRAFCLSTLVRESTLWSMYLPGTTWQSTSTFERNSSATSGDP
jgi:hypothetical protein